MCSRERSIITSRSLLTTLKSAHHTGSQYCTPWHLVCTTSYQKPCWGPSVVAPRLRRSQRESSQKMASLGDLSKEIDQSVHASWGKGKGRRSACSRDAGKRVRQQSPSSSSSEGKVLVIGAGWRSIQICSLRSWIRG